METPWGVSKHRFGPLGGFNRSKLPRAYKYKPQALIFQIWNFGELAKPCRTEEWSSSSTQEIESHQIYITRIQSLVLSRCGNSKKSNYLAFVEISASVSRPPRGSTKLWTWSDCQVVHGYRHPRHRLKTHASKRRRTDLVFIFKKVVIFYSFVIWIHL